MFFSIALKLINPEFNNSESFQVENKLKNINNITLENPKESIKEKKKKCC